MISSPVISCICRLSVRDEYIKLRGWTLSIDQVNSVNGIIVQSALSHSCKEEYFLHTLQPADLGWPTGNGKKLSCCQAQLSQATCLAVAYLLSISCRPSYVRRLYTAEAGFSVANKPSNELKSASKWTYEAKWAWDELSAISSLLYRFIWNKISLCEMNFPLWNKPSKELFNEHNS